MSSASQKTSRRGRVLPPCHVNAVAARGQSACRSWSLGPPYWAGPPYWGELAESVADWLGRSMGVASRRRPSVASRGWREVGMQEYGPKLGNWGLTPLTKNIYTAVHSYRNNNAIFTALHGMQTRYSDEKAVRPSVCLSVCLSNACIVTKRKKDLTTFLHHTERSYGLVF